MLLALNGQVGNVVTGLAVAATGVWFLRASFSRELRRRRADPEDPPVVRSDGTDRLVRIACFCLGVPMLAAGLLLAFAAVFARD